MPWAAIRGRSSWAEFGRSWPPTSSSERRRFSRPDLARGSIEIHAGSEKLETIRSFWVDANAPFIRLEATGEKRLQMVVNPEFWRVRPRVVEGRESHSAYGLGRSSRPVAERPDTIWLGASHEPIWLQRNENSPWYDILKHEECEPLAGQLKHPILHQTIGRTIFGVSFRKVGPTTPVTRKGAKRHNLWIVAMTMRTPSAAEGVSAVEMEAGKAAAMSRPDARATRERWWSQRSSRSDIRASGSGEAEVVSRGYALQRLVPPAQHVWRTTLEMVFCAGKIVKLNVTPDDRNEGVRVLDSQ